MKNAIKNLSFALFFCTSCMPQKPVTKEAVKTTYMHQYGVQVRDEADWLARGATGQVIRSQKDGVVIRETYREGTLNGITSTTFAHSDTIAKNALFDAGVLVEETVYFLSGAQKSKKTYKQDGTVFATSWYEDGAPCAEEEYKTKLLVNGNYFSTAQKKESSVKEGFGVRTLRDGLGELVARETCEKGLVVLQETYYSSGAPSAQTPYTNGKIHGIRKTFFAGGEPKSIEEWEQGSLHGTVKLFQNGQLAASVPYCYGLKHGKEIHFQNGSDIIAEEIDWSFDKRHGPTLHIVEGQKIVDWYFEGKKVPKSHYIELAKG